MSKPIASVESKVIYEFGSFRVDTAERVLLREGAPVPLTPKAFDVLSLLVESHGHIVEKSEVMDRVWADSFVEEGNLKATVAMIRKALGESASGSRYIETVPRRGYRFRAEVTQSRSDDLTLMVQERTRSVVTIEVEEIHAAGDNGDNTPDRTGESAPGANLNDALAAAAPQSIGLADSTTTPGLSRRVNKITRLRKGSLLMLALGVIILACIAGWLYRSPRHRGAETFTSMKVSKLTNNGNTRFAAISPDGKYLADVSEEAGRQSLWVKLVATGNAVQIVPPAQVEFMGLVFSRDGAFIYYTAISKGDPKANLYQVSALGGPAKKVKEDVDSPPSFSPDGEQFAFVREHRDQGVSTLMIAGLDDVEERSLVSRRLPDFLDYPAWSPDGKIIICTVVSSSGHQVGLVQVNVKDGTEKPLTPATWPYIVQPRWLRDGSGLVMSAKDRSPRNFQLWYLAYPGGEARRITEDYNSYEGVSLTDDGGSLVTVQKNLVSTVWTCALEDPDHVQQITDAAGAFRDPVWTSAGKIVYALDVNDKGHLWIMSADGGDQRQLTFDDANYSGPSITPDGSAIVFLSDRAGPVNIWRCDFDGSNPRRLTFGNGELSPRCSADDKWVIYISASRTTPTLWKAPIDGGEATQLTARPVRRVAVSPDGKWLACLYSSESTISPEAPPTITIMSFPGGETQKVVSMPSSFVQARDMQWTPDGQAIVLIANRDGALNIWMQPLDGGPPKPLTNFKHNQLLAFGLSGDGKLVYSRGSLGNDVVLISRFR